ncbi:MAG TPA: TonB family protein [Vicinamibacterales bacterium]|nr:TonB family protein [Vicinamibacterales bacterium]
MTRPPPAPFPGSGSQPSGGRGTGSAGPTPSGFVARYQLLERIGEGGMGSLYLARDPAIDRLVAIKLLKRGFDTEALRERFAREARAAGRLRHLNIVTIFDVGEHDGDPFIAMEFLAGETLAELIRQGARLTLSRRLKLLEELCDGLAYAHRAGLVHRDIKPANLMVDAGGVLKILDFGIVRADEAGMTQAGVLVGTINYMAPEQVLGTGVDHRSDIFAVGLVGYELITGRQAFPGTMKDGLLKRIPEAEFEPLTALVPNLDPDVTDILNQALQKNPSDRYQDLARMRNDFARVRQRLEAAEERAAADAAAGAGETAVIALEPTSPGVILEPPPASAPELLADAERALAGGQYRFALTIAGRAAAMDPQDRSPSGIVARAEAALLERGRSSESSGAGRPASSGSLTVGPATPSAPGTAATGQMTSRGTYLAIAVALLALIVAAIALWPQFWDNRAASPVASRDAQAGSAEAVEPARGGPAVGPSPPADPLSTPPSPPATKPAEPEPQPDVSKRADPPGPRSAPRGNGDRRAGSVPPASRAAAETPKPTAKSRPSIAPAGPVRVGAGVSEPRRARYVEPEYPAEARVAGVEGTVRVELTIDRDGRVAEAHVVQSVPLLDAAALAAARRWEFEPTIVDGQAVAVIHTVPVRFDRPPAGKPPSLPGAAPRPAAPPPARPEKTPETGRGPAPPPRDLRAEAEAAIREALGRYEAAWESLDADALRRVHALSDGEIAQVRETMRGASRYAMDVAVRDITIDDGFRTASARCAITREFDARIGSAPRQTATQTLRFEKRGDTWMIVSIR